MTSKRCGKRLGDEPRLTVAAYNLREHQQNARKKRAANDALPTTVNDCKNASISAHNKTAHFRVGSGVD